MPGVELSSLNRDEMRRLLAAAETRRDHALAERLRRELDGRGATTALPVQQMHAVEGRPDHGRRPESRDAKDWDSKDWEAKIWDAEDGDVRGKARAGGRIGSTILTVAVASAVAMVVGWQLGRRASDAPVPPPPAAVAPAQIALPAQPLPTVALPPPPGPAPLAVEVAPAPPAVVKPAAKPVKARAERRAAPRRSDRDRRVLQAYDRARAAGVDPLTLDADQARFRTAVESTRDPVRTNALYARRIKELEAAAKQGR